MRISKKIKQQIFERDGHKCKSCGINLDPKCAEVHHVVPISKGGTDDPSNLVTLCSNCNWSIADKLIHVATTPVSKQLAESWFNAFKKAPALTSTLSIIIAIVTVSIAIYSEHNQKIKLEIERKENLNYYSQIKQLDDTENNIKQLLVFVKEQQKSLSSTQSTIESLKAEKEKLEPLVASDRKVIEALFITQEERNQNNVTRERWIGFALGLVASIFASTIIMIVRFFISKSKSTT